MLGLGLAIHLAQSRVCSILLCVYGVINTISYSFRRESLADGWFLWQQFMLLWQLSSIRVLGINIARVVRFLIKIYQYKWLNLIIHKCTFCVSITKDIWKRLWKGIVTVRNSLRKPPVDARRQKEYSELALKLPAEPYSRSRRTPPLPGNSMIVLMSACNNMKQSGTAKVFFRLYDSSSNDRDGRFFYAGYAAT